MLPKYPEKSREAYIRKVFGGYDRSDGAAESSFYSMRNMSSRRYPYLSPRKARDSSEWTPGSKRVLGAFTCHKSSGEVLGVIHSYDSTRDTLVYVDPQTGKLLSAQPIYTAVGTKRQTASIGARTAVFPDKIMLDHTTGLDTVIPLENERKVTGEAYEGFGVCGYYMTDLSAEDGDDALELGDSWDADEPPASPNNGQLWLDRGNRQNDPYGTYVGEVRCYSAASKAWVDVYPTYVKLRYPGIGVGFAVGDCVTVECPENSGPIRSVAGEHIIEAVGDDYVVVQGILEYSEANLDYLNPFHHGIKITRHVPDVDYVISSGNRLWGCRSVMNTAECINEIYVSALGDPTNWNRFDGIASDSYAVSIGEGGAFTGAVSYGDVPHFFKERCLIKVLGTDPSSYETVSMILDGVERGSHESIASAGGRLIYKSKRGFMAYSGGLPVLISRELGEATYKSAVSGELDGLYYTSVLNESGSPELFVYDTVRGIWHREDETAALFFRRTAGRLFAVCEGSVIAMDASADSGERFTWSCDTGLMGLNDPDEKYVSRVKVRANIPEGAYLELSFEYDSSGIFKVSDTFTGRGVGTRLCAVIPKRCDHLRMRLSGEGDVRIYSIAYEYEHGG